MLGYSFSWRRVLDRFSEQREVFAPDMPGSGFSEYSAALDARLSAAAERLLSFLDVVGIASCDLIGSSYGGTTSMLLAVTHPERVRTLTLVSPANPWSRIGRKRLALLNMPGMQAVFPPLARRLRPLHRISVQQCTATSRVTAETLHGYSSRWSARERSSTRSKSPKTGAPTCSNYRWRFRPLPNPRADRVG